MSSRNGSLPSTGLVETDMEEDVTLWSPDTCFSRGIPQSAPQLSPKSLSTLGLPWAGHCRHSLEYNGNTALEISPHLHAEPGHWLPRPWDSQNRGVGGDAIGKQLLGYESD